VINALDQAISQGGDAVLVVDNESAPLVRTYSLQEKPDIVSSTEAASERNLANRTEKMSQKARKT
jgi:hypothetical protein